MSFVEKKHKSIDFLKSQLFQTRFLNAYKLHNKTTESITTPFADYSNNVLVYCRGKLEIKSLAGKTKNERWPFYYISREQFYSITLEPGQSVIMFHMGAKKSAGYLDTSVSSNQANYVYTFLHEDDVRDPTVESQQEDLDKCVI